MANYVSVMVDLDQIPDGDERAIFVQHDGSINMRSTNGTKFPFENQRYIKAPYNGYDQFKIFETIRNDTMEVYDDITNSVQVYVVSTLSGGYEIVIRSNSPITGYVLLG